MASASSVHLTCLCGAISISGKHLADLELPISEQLCHCNPCRYTTGALGGLFPKLKASPPQVALSKLKAYSSSEKLTRYFCSTCGCHCFVHTHQDDTWFVLGGIMEPDPALKAGNFPFSEDMVKLSSHDYVLDTVDGGLTPLLLEVNGRSIPAWPAEPPEPSSSQENAPKLLPSTVHSLPSKAAKAVPQPREDSYLPARCHCGGVSLLIKRANFPPHSDPATRPRYIPSDPTKYVASLCACRSCRLSTGVSITAWTLIPPENVFNANAPRGAAIDQPRAAEDNNLVPVACGPAASSPDANQGLHLNHHWSSEDVCRSFCGTCGATVSYWCGERPDELDLTVGILRAEEGSMARKWLEWVGGEVGFGEECTDRELCDALSGAGTEILDEFQVS